MNTAEPSSRGASDFLSLLEARQHRVWAFAAIEAGPGIVSGAVADELGPSVFFESASFRPPAKVQRDSSPEVAATDWIAVVKPKAGAWTVIYLALAPRSPYWLSRLYPLSQELAETLGVRAFAARRDEAGEVECRLYENEALIEEIAFTPGEPFRHWQSSRREAPPWDKVELSFVSELCAGLDLRVPAGYPAVRGDEAFFATEEKEIARVDLMLPPAPAEETMVLEDDETVIFQTADLEGTAPPAAPPREPERTPGWGVKAIWGRLFGGRD